MSAALPSSDNGESLSGSPWAKLRTSMAEMEKDWSTAFDYIKTTLNARDEMLSHKDKEIKTLKGELSKVKANASAEVHTYRDTMSELERKLSASEGTTAAVERRNKQLEQELAQRDTGKAMERELKTRLKELERKLEERRRSLSESTQRLLRRVCGRRCEDVDGLAGLNLPQPRGRRYESPLRRLPRFYYECMYVCMPSSIVAASARIQRG